MKVDKLKFLISKLMQITNAMLASKPSQLLKFPYYLSAARYVFERLQETVQAFS